MAIVAVLRCFMSKQQYIGKTATNFFYFSFYESLFTTWFILFLAHYFQFVFAARQMSRGFLSRNKGNHALNRVGPDVHVKQSVVQHVKVIAQTGETFAVAHEICLEQSP